MNFLFQSYNLQRAFILTQMPLSNTIIEFWRLVQDYETSCIVMLNGIDECGVLVNNYVIYVCVFRCRYCMPTYNFTWKTKLMILFELIVI